MPYYILELVEPVFIKSQALPFLYSIVDLLNLFIEGSVVAKLRVAS